MAERHEFRFQRRVVSHATSWEEATAYGETIDEAYASIHPRDWEPQDLPSYSAWEAVPGSVCLSSVDGQETYEMSVEQEAFYGVPWLVDGALLGESYRLGGSMSLPEILCGPASVDYLSPRLQAPSDLNYTCLKKLAQRYLSENWAHNCIHDAIVCDYSDINVEKLRDYTEAEARKMFTLCQQLASSFSVEFNPQEEE